MDQLTVIFRKTNQVETSTLILGSFWTFVFWLRGNSFETNQQVNYLLDRNRTTTYTICIQILKYFAICHEYYVSIFFVA